MSDYIDDGGAAFPFEGATEQVPNSSFARRKFHHGMTLRDWFAGKALAGMMACSYQIERGDDPDCSDVGVWPATESRCGEEVEIAKESYRIADAMLAERAKREARQ